MDYNQLWDDSEYEKTLPCPLCKELANPTVAGGNWKCHECGHLFRDDGTKPEQECHCVKCAPHHDALAGKTRGKKAELDLDDRKEEKKPKKSKSIKSSKKRRPLPPRN